MRDLANMQGDGPRWIVLVILLFVTVVIVFPVKWYPQ